MPALKNLVGQKFGRLTVVERSGLSATGKATWVCACDCGRQHTAVGTELRSGHTSSCGCWRVERNRTSDLRHGMRGTATYKTWEAMKTRCGNPASKSYPGYGGRGIKVCERWTIFENFLADMGERPNGTTLDRWPDNNGNYEPGNCRWASKQEQQRNTTANVLVEFEGQTLTQAAWAERLGISQATLSYRLRRGWSVSDALTRKAHSGNRVVASKLGEEVELP